MIFIGLVSIFDPERSNIIRQKREEQKARREHINGATTTDLTLMNSMDIAKQRRERKHFQDLMIHEQERSKLFAGNEEAKAKRKELKRLKREKSLTASDSIALSRPRRERVKPKRLMSRKESPPRSTRKRKR